jgi:hypothetical protein
MEIIERPPGGWTLERLMAALEDPVRVRVPSFAQILGKWASAANLSRDMNVDVRAVATWARSNSVSPRHWVTMVKAAERRGIEGVTLYDLFAAYMQRLVMNPSRVWEKNRTDPNRKSKRIPVGQPPGKKPPGPKPSIAWGGEDC